MKTGTPNAQAVRDRAARCCTTGPQARDRRARPRRRHQSDHRLHGAGRVPLRVDAQLHVAAHALGHRRLAGRAGKQLGRARAQPDGSPLPRRRGGRSRDSTTSTTTAAAQPASTSRATAICSATSAPYLRGFGYQGGAGRDGWSRAVAELGVGGAFKDEMARAGPVDASAPRRSARCCRTTRTRSSLDETKKDKWGMPVLKIDCATGENERLMRKDMVNDMAEMLEQMRREGREDVRQRVLPRHGHPRDGHGAHGRGARRTRCSTSTIRCGTRLTCSSPTARAWHPPRARTHRSRTWRSRRARPTLPWPS